jgi:hypothetical protein
LGEKKNNNPHYSRKISSLAKEMKVKTHAEGVAIEEEMAMERRERPGALPVTSSYNKLKLQTKQYDLTLLAKQKHHADG